jgi:hypothetical protein
LIILFSFCGLNSYGAMEYEREESIGYITGEQAALQFFQKGVTAAFSIGFDGLMDGVVGSFKGFGILAEGLENLGKSIIKNNFNSWVNAFELDGKGGWDWNGEAYQESAWGSGALGMYASAFVTPMAQRGATDFFTQDGTGLDLAENVFGVENLKALGSTLGSLTGEFASYLFDGEFSVNVLDMSDLTGGAVKQGLFELSFKGKSRIGGGGANLGGLTGILNSLEAIKTDALYVASRKLGGNRGLAEINATNRLGYSSIDYNIDLARRIIEGETKVSFFDFQGEKEGEFDSENPDILYVDVDYLNNDKESASKLASILAHEGMHQMGEKREFFAYAFSALTYSILQDKGLASDDLFLDAQYAQMKDPKNLIPNEIESKDDLTIKYNGQADDALRMFRGPSITDLMDEFKIQTFNNTRISGDEAYAFFVNVSQDIAISFLTGAGSGALMKKMGITGFKAILASGSISAMTSFQWNMITTDPYALDWGEKMEGHFKGLILDLGMTALFSGAKLALENLGKFPQPMVEFLNKKLAYTNYGFRKDGGSLIFEMMDAATNVTDFNIANTAILLTAMQVGNDYLLSPAKAIDGNWHEQMDPTFFSDNSEELLSNIELIEDFQSTFDGLDPEDVLDKYEEIERRFLDDFFESTTTFSEDNPYYFIGNENWAKNQGSYIEVKLPYGYASDYRDEVDYTADNRLIMLSLLEDFRMNRILSDPQKYLDYAFIYMEIE